MQQRPETQTRTPRWVKVFAIVALVLVILFAIVHLSGHGLGEHAVHLQHK